jgi:hypothetical protein
MANLTEMMMQAVAEGEELTETPRVPYAGEVCLAGRLVKLGQRVRNWKERWVVIRGDGTLEYFKGQPTPQRGLGLMTPQGAIKLRRDCVELLTWNGCALAMQQMSHEGGALRSAIRWPPGASARNAFGIRTPFRTYLFFAPDGEARTWLEGIGAVCRGADAFLGIDAVERPRATGGLQRSHSTPHGRPPARAATGRTATHSTPTSPGAQPQGGKGRAASVSHPSMAARGGEEQRSSRHLLSQIGAGDGMFRGRGMRVGCAVRRIKRVAMSALTQLRALTHCC